MITAKNYASELCQSPMFVHYDRQKMVWRIGELADQDDHDSVASSELHFFANFDRSLVPPLPRRRRALKTATSIPNIPAASIPTIQAPSVLNVATASIPSASNNNNVTATNVTPDRPSVPKIPKPRNAWIIYRQEKHQAVLDQNPGMHTSKICRSSSPEV